MAASSTTASVVLAAVPGDATTPIADKLADVSGYMAVASILIPVLTLLVMWWLMKLIFSSTVQSDAETRMLLQRIEKKIN